MNKLPIKKVVEGLLKLQDTGESATLLGIGPMSPNLLQMCIRDSLYAHRYAHDSMPQEAGEYSTLLQLVLWRY